MVVTSEECLSQHVISITSSACSNAPEHVQEIPELHVSEWHQVATTITRGQEASEVHLEESQAIDSSRHSAVVRRPGAQLSGEVLRELTRPLEGLHIRAEFGKMPVNERLNEAFPADVRFMPRSIMTTKEPRTLPGAPGQDMVQASFFLMDLKEPSMESPHAAVLPEDEVDQRW